MYKHVCGCNEYFPNIVDLCHKHILNRFNTESIQDVIKIVLKLFNFHNYHNKFVLNYCHEHRHNNYVCKNISIISIDGTVKIILKLSNNDLHSGYIAYNRLYIYEILNNILIWDAGKIPNLDPIKKHLRNLAIHV